MQEESEEQVDDQKELVMVGDGVEEGDQQDAPVDGKKDEEKSEELAADDSRVGADENEDGDDGKKDARKTESKTRRQRQKAARERDRRELTFLRSRNDQVERQLSDLTRRQTQTEVSQVDQRINQIDGAIRSAEDVYAKAIDAGEGKDAAEAQRIRDGLRDQRGELIAFKSQHEESADDPQRDAPDPNFVANLRAWHGKNKWFDFNRGDQDSAIAGAIDDTMGREGWDPRTPEYYDELDRRLAKQMPHLKNGAADDTGDDDAGGDEDKGGRRKQPSGGPQFRVGGERRPLRSNEVHVSKERREAMEEAGAWEDPVLRKKYLAQYAKYDLEHANDNA